MRITFFSSIRHMPYEHYHKKPMSMCAIESNPTLSKNPNLEFLNCSNRNTCHPMIRKYSHNP